MNFHAMVAWRLPAGLVLAAGLAVIVLHYCPARVRMHQRRRCGTRYSRLSPFCLALGMAFMQLACLFSPADVCCLLERKVDEDADDAGDAAAPAGRLRHVHGRLRRIWRGEPVEKLVWKM